MLDDLKLIHERDAQDALGIAEKQWQQLKHDFGVTWRPSNQPDFNFRSIALAGMGGSALAATVLQSWPQTLVPFEIIRNYALPMSINNETLFIASSYSGNTEESLDALEAAEAEDCEIVVITSGGALERRAVEKAYPIFRIPSGMQPRHSVFYQLAALVQLLAPTGLIGSDKVQELQKKGDWLKEHITAWTPTVPTAQNLAKQIAQELVGKSIVVYAGPKLYPAAYKWKISFNENAKHIAWVNQYPEFNHNEMLGWTKQPVDKPYAVIDLRSSLENPGVQKRFEVTERLLSGVRPSPIVVESQGETLLEQLLWTIALGDFVSLYLAILNGLNPTPVDLIEKFKKELG